jgi:hypothetical protein
MKYAIFALAALTVVACGAAPDASPEDRTPTGKSGSELALPGTTALVNFDSATAYAPPLGTITYYLGDGTIVDNTYGGNGVAFTCIVCASGHAYARYSTGFGNNGVSLFATGLPFFDARFGAVQATFASPRRWVSIDARAVLPPEYVGTPVAKPWMEAYDASGTFLGRMYYPLNYGDPGYGGAQRLTVSMSSASIKTVRFSSQHFSSSPSVYGEFDNLRYNTDLVKIPRQLL